MCFGKERKRPVGIESQRPPPGPAEIAVAGQRIEGADTQAFVEQRLGGLAGSLLNLTGQGTQIVRRDPTKAGDVASGRVGKAYGAADLRITAGIPYGPQRAPTADPNRPPLTIPRPGADASIPTLSPSSTDPLKTATTQRPRSLIEALARVRQMVSSPTARSFYGSRG